MDYVDSMAQEEAGVPYTVLPLTFGDELKPREKDIITMVEKHLISKKGGLAYFSKSMTDHIGPEKIRAISDVICDVIIISRSDVPYILTFSNDASSSTCLRYNLCLAKAVLKKLRLFIGEDFTFAFGLIGVHDLASDHSFKKRLQLIKSSSTRFALRKYLAMNASKCDVITRGFITMSGVARYPVDVDNFKMDSGVIQIVLDRDKLKKMLNNG